MMMRLMGSAFVSGSLLGCASAHRNTPQNAGNSALADAIAAACEAQIVFLGEEGSHGGGRTFQIKTDIVRDLIKRCGFTHVAFESQIYDFVDLQERYTTGSATREALYDAIGGLWSRAAEIDPLVHLLHDKALARQLTISGFDGHIGGATSYYTQTMLAQQLAGIARSQASALQSRIRPA